MINEAGLEFLQTGEGHGAREKISAVFMAGDGPGTVFGGVQNL